MTIICSEIQTRFVNILVKKLFGSSKAMVHQPTLYAANRGVHSGHRVDFGSGVSGRFKIEFCVHISFYIIVTPFLSWVKSSSIIRSGEYEVNESVLNTFSWELKISVLVS